MTVYLYEKDALKDFVRERVDGNKEICIDTSHFATWIYAGKMGYSSKSYEAYGDLVEETMKQFPLIGIDDVLRSISSVLRETEKEWLNSWVKHMKTVSSDDILQGDVNFGYSPNYPDC